MDAQLKELEQLPDVLKVDEFARLLRINRGLAYEMIRRNEVQAIRLGRAIRIPKLTVQRLIEGGGQANGQNR